MWLSTYVVEIFGVLKHVADHPSFRLKVQSAHPRSTAEAQHIANHIPTENPRIFGNHSLPVPSCFCSHWPGFNNDTQSGGVISTKGTLNILGGEFRGNRAEDRGAVIRSDDESTTELAGGVFIENYAADGGVVFVESNSQLTVSGGELCDNEANKRGGAFCVTENGSIKVGEGMRRALGLVC